MIRYAFSVLLLVSVMSFGAQGSGFFIEAHLSQGKAKGDTLFCVAKSFQPLLSNKTEYQYAVRYAFMAGYELSFNKVISLRGAIGYQKALLDAYAASIPGVMEGNMEEVPYIDSEIDRHWLNIPIDFKVNIPIRRGGIYVTTGPKMSFLLSSEYTDNIDDITIDAAEETPRFNLSIGFHLGAEIPIARVGNLFVQTGYYFGILNVAPTSYLKTRENEFALLGIGFRLNLPKIRG